MQTKYEILKKLLLEKEELERRKEELIRETSSTAPTEEEDDDDYFTGDLYSVINQIKFIEESVEALKQRSNCLKAQKLKRKMKQLKTEILSI